MTVPEVRLNSTAKFIQMNKFTNYRSIFAMRNIFELWHFGYTIFMTSSKQRMLLQHTIHFSVLTLFMRVILIKIIRPCIQRSFAQVLLDYDVIMTQFRIAANFLVKFIYLFLAFFFNSNQRNKEKRIWCIDKRNTP